MTTASIDCPNCKSPVAVVWWQHDLRIEGLNGTWTDRTMKVEGTHKCPPAEVKYFKTPEVASASGGEDG